jgi:hypothetical protein
MTVIGKIRRILATSTTIGSPVAGNVFREADSFCGMKPYLSGSRSGRRASGAWRSLAGGKADAWRSIRDAFAAACTRAPEVLALARALFARPSPNLTAPSRRHHPPDPSGRRGGAGRHPRGAQARRQFGCPLVSDCAMVVQDPTPRYSSGPDAWVEIAGRDAATPAHAPAAFDFLRACRQSDGRLGL